MDDINDDNLNETGDSSMLASSKKSRFTSDVWAFFERVEVNNHGIMVPKNKCGVCKTLFRGGSSAGTSHLRRRLMNHEKGQKKLGADISRNINAFAFDKNVARKGLVDYVIRAELPFTFVEKHDFKGMICRGFCPQYRGISSSTCKRDVMGQFTKGKAELLSVFEKFDGKVCLDLRYLVIASKNGLPVTYGTFY